MKITSYVIPFLLYTVALTSCNGSTSTSAISPVDVKQTTQFTSAPQSSQTPTLQLIESTFITSTVTAENPNLKDIVFGSCLAIHPEHLDGNEIPWDVLILRGIIPFAINPNTGKRTEQLIQDPDPHSNGPITSDFSLSPDGKWLAYNLYRDNKDSLIVEPASNILKNSSQGRIIWSPSQPFRLDGWVSNENVLLVKNHNRENFGSTLIYNPFTGEQHEFSLEEMPNSLNQQYGMSGSYLMDHGNLMPAPDLSRIVYPLDREAEGFHLALWDVENKKILVRLKYTLSQSSRDPFWSQDNSNFLIAGSDPAASTEWFQVTKNGVIHQLTYFGEFLEDAKFEYPSRSWDGRYLAFQLTYNKRKNSKYIFLDLNSQHLDGFCLNLGGEDSGSLHSPVWSPDNRYVVITNGVYLGNTSDVIIVDVKKRDASYLGSDSIAPIYAIGWIVKP